MEPCSAGSDSTPEPSMTRRERLLATSPRFAAAYEQARARAERVVSTLCQWGNCVVLVDPLDGTVDSSFGPVACPCDNTPGWKSKYLEGQSRPPVPVRVRGRHGSRAQRSRRRHTLPTWDDWAWLPAASRVRVGGR